MGDKYCNWSELHKDLLELILKELATSVPDCLRFGAVCVSWRSVLVPHFHPSLLRPQLPLLMIPTPPSPRQELETRSFYNLFEERIYKEIQIKLPYERHYCGSSHGWLITSGDESTEFSVELFNPLISINNECHQKIQLPPLTAFPTYPEDNGVYDLKKAVLSADPTSNPNDYVVMTIYGVHGRLTFWKPGDEVWHPVPWHPRNINGDQVFHPMPLHENSGNVDVIYNKGMFYVVNSEGDVSVWDLGGGCDGSHLPHYHPIKVKKIKSSSTLPKASRGVQRYLVKSCSSGGDLLMVHRLLITKMVWGERESSPHSTTGFIVFKLQDEVKGEGGLLHSSPSKWMRIINLEDQMLFIGNNASMSLTASQFPGGKSNHIYFTDDKYDSGCRDMGVFSCDDWRIKEIHPMGSKDYILPATAVWVEPTLRSCLRFWKTNKHDPSSRV